MKLATTTKKLVDTKKGGGGKSARSKKKDKGKFSQKTLLPQKEWLQQQKHW